MPFWMMSVVLSANVQWCFSDKGMDALETVILRYYNSY